MQRGSAIIRSLGFCAALLGTILLPAFAETAQLDSELREQQKKASEGDAQSAFALGNAYDTGTNTVADPVEAKKWWRKAAELGHPDASFHLAQRLLRENNASEAIIWLKRAGELGHAGALGNLGFLYEQGRGVAPNLRMAYFYYLQAADLGLAEAMWNLANLYGSGQYLGESDMMQGCIWSRRAARFASEKEEALRELLGKITPLIEQSLDAEELRACHRLADAWKPEKLPAPQLPVQQ